jgi:hypothetical protein
MGNCRILRNALMSAALACLLPGLAFHRADAAPSAAPSSRIDVPVTLQVATPYVDWGKPSPGAPIRAFVIPSVSEGRTLVELAQRIDLQFDTVTIDDAWDVNTWTMGTDDNYEARNYKLLYQYVEEDLAKPTPYDVIVLPSLHGWNRLPEGVRAAVRRRVEAGAGLVLIHPTTGRPAPDDPPTERPGNNFAPDYGVAPGDELWDISPLVGVLSDRLDRRGYREIRPDAVAAGPWKKVADHYITANTPLEDFPSGDLKHYLYRLGKDSTALATGESGEPVIATKMFGKGRVVALGYVNAGLSPMIDWKVLGKQDDRWWEYLYSLLGRAIIWAAQREPGIVLRPMTVSGQERKTVALTLDNATPIDTADVMAEVWNEWGEKEGAAGITVHLKRGANAAALDLPPSVSAGRHTVDVIVTAEGSHYDWGSVCFDIPKPDAIASLATDREAYTRGDNLQVRLETREKSFHPFLAELLDHRGRLLARQKVDAAPADSAAPAATLTVGNYSTLIGWVRVTLYDGISARPRVIDRQQVRVNFASLDRGFGAYELIMPWFGPPSYQPWTPTLNEQFRQLGTSVTEDPTRPFKLVAGLDVPGFGVYWHYRKSYVEQKDKFLETGDKKYLIREPDLASDAWLETLRGKIRESMAKYLPYRPLAYYLADESSLTAYEDPLDFSWSAPTLAQFRTWLKEQYASLEALNAEWESAFKSWDEIVPLTTPEAQAKGQFAGWMDHRTFMERVFAHAVRVAAEEVHAQDPGGLASISGTQSPGPSNAVNWYLLDQIVDYLQPYSGDGQDDLHRTMHPGQILTGFTGYQSHGKALRFELWHRLFHGQTGASVFWHYTALNPDLTLTEQGRDLSDSVREFRDEGLALLLRGAQRENCGIAVHYSLYSVRGQWITDGHILPHEASSGDETSPHLRRFHQNRDAWLQALNDAGYQYDFLTTEQIEAGKLKGFKVLVLPDSLALSSVELAAIRKFVEGGGLLIADAETGLMDQHARWQTSGLLDGVLGVQRVNTRSAAPDPAPVKVQLPVGNASDEFELLPVDSTLRTTIGQPGAALGNTLFLVDNRVGQGRSILLNFWMTDYPQLRKAGGQGARLALLRSLVSLGAAFPVADVRRASGAPLACSEVTAFEKGSTRFLAVLPEPGCADIGAVTLHLPSLQYVYDLRAHRLLGRLGRVAGTLVGGEPLFLAFVPAPVAHLEVSGKAPGALRVQAGATVQLLLRPAARAGETAADTAVHIEVRNPLGKVLDYYGGDIALPAEGAEFSIPLALDDRPGAWRVTVREPFSHLTATTTFAVSR